MFLTIIIFAVVLGLLVFVHEFGHFIVAKKSGMKVEEFGFGFPPRLWGVKKSETVYSINWIPLGGFVKIKGENGETREPDSFASQTFFKKAAVLSAGVIMNIALAFVIFSIGLMFGLPSVIDQDNLKGATVVGPIKVQVAGVADDSPAQKAGISGGDWIKQTDDKKIENISQLQEYVASHQEQEIYLVYERNNEQMISTIRPQTVQGSQNKALGVNLVQTGRVRYGFFNSWFQGFLATLDYLWQIITALLVLLKGLILGQGLSVDLAGPIGVAYMTGQATKMGFGYLLNFTALLSLNLAVINILPFPALDGGRLFFAIIEAIRRRPNNQKIENIVHTAGFALLMLLVLVITYRDVLRYGSSAIDKIKSIF